MLLVQHQALAARALARFLGKYYADLALAGSPEAAEELLTARTGVPTHLVCGQNFGPDAPGGQDLVVSWRQRFPDISWAVLATGAEGLASNLVGVDAVYEKSARLSVLLNLLSVRDNSRSHLGSSYYSTQLKDDKMKEIQTPKAHNVSTLKERLVQAPKTDKLPGSLSSAQGFAVA